MFVFGYVGRKDVRHMFDEELERRYEEWLEFIRKVQGGVDPTTYRAPSPYSFYEIEHEHGRRRYLRDAKDRGLLR